MTTNVSVSSSGSGSGCRGDGVCELVSKVCLLLGDLISVFPTKTAQKQLSW